MKLGMKTKLRVRFVLISALALLFLLGVIVSVSLYLNYRDLEERSDLILEQLKETPDLNVRYFSVKVHPAKGAIRPDVVQNVSVSPTEAARLAKIALESGTKKGFAEDFRFLLIRSDGGIRIFFLSRTSVMETARNAAKNLIGISILSLMAAVAVLIPLSARVVAPLAENHRKQKEFITAASHQLKTPLTVISADAQLLSLEIGENEWVESILCQVERMTNMTNSLVALSKAEELNEKTEKAPFSISDAVTETAELYKALVEKKQTETEVSVAENVVFNGNEEDFCHLLTLILDNAFKYCPDGGKIRLALRKDIRGFRLTVENTTSPLGDETLLAQRFYRGKNAEGKDGFGLGLAIASSLAARMGGKISVTLPKEDLFRAEITFH
ncbi:MAG: HAMP domain-containing histidine kinase [Clostridia bacterium]|nr:HAMP domain-containing histidine kinase [Clostridia bacterium]